MEFDTNEKNILEKNSKNKTTNKVPIEKKNKFFLMYLED